MNKTWTAILIIVILAIGAWFVFGSKNTPSKTVRIGVSQITSHIVFDNIKTGIINGFAKAGYTEGKNISFDFQNAQGDNGTNAAIAQKFANGGYDLFMPLGTQSSQALVNLVKDKPGTFNSEAQHSRLLMVSTNLIFF